MTAMVSPSHAPDAALAAEMASLDSRIRALRALPPSEQRDLALRLAVLRRRALLDTPDADAVARTSPTAVHHLDGVADNTSTFRVSRLTRPSRWPPRRWVPR